jgi:hypothetical protein
LDARDAVPRQQQRGYARREGEVAQHLDVVIGEVESIVGLHNTTKRHEKLAMSSSFFCPLPHLLSFRARCKGEGGEGSKAKKNWKNLRPQHPSFQSQEFDVLFMPQRQKGLPMYQKILITNFQKSITRKAEEKMAKKE